MPFAYSLRDHIPPGDPGCMGHGTITRRYTQMLGRILVACALLITAPVAADQVTYQPGPFQGTDVWFGSVYNQSGVDDDKLQAGGWGDEYDFLIRFDLEGLPQNATQAMIFLAPYSKGDNSQLVNLRLHRVLSSWDESTGYFTRPSSSYITTYVAPTLGYWYGIDITSIYNGWKNGTYPNWGLEYRPQGTNNQFSQFRSSDYGTWGLRPYLQVTFNPTATPPALKSPLPGGGKYWMLTTEIGGTDCANPGEHLSSHVDGNYFSIDLGRTSLKNGVTTVESDVPVYAAAGGKVTFAGTNPSIPGNGNYVVIDHDGDGNENTGYTTRYLHLRDTPLVSSGNTVVQGQQIGIMGGSGGWPVHLHFGVRYGNSGASSVNALSFVKMEGLNLKSYITECSGATRIRYYLSTNTQ
jgi:hypothetical protein